MYSESNGDKIFINKFPFYIGSWKEYVDYTICCETISRFHAKMEEEENHYYVIDLNSTNGTMLNGCFLNAHKREELRNGDQIQFANQIYLFYEEE